MKNTFFQTISAKLAGISAFLAILSVAVIIVYVSYSVLARWLFNASVKNVIEICAYMFISMTAFGIPYVFESSSHIRVSFLFDLIPEKIRFIFGIVGNLLTAVYLFVMIISGVRLAIDSFQLGSTAATPLGTPSWIPELLLPVGFIIFLFQIVANGFNDKKL